MAKATLNIMLIVPEVNGASILNERMVMVRVDGRDKRGNYSIDLFTRPTDAASAEKAAQILSDVLRRG